MQFTVEKIPATLAEFNALFDLTTPESTAAAFLCACEMFMANRNMGTDAMNAIRGPRPMTGYDVQFLRDRLMDKAYLPKSYFNGATPANNYEPTQPYTLEVYADPRPSEPGYTSVMLQSGGADSRRAMTLRGKGGKWYLWSYSSILLDIRRPKAEDPWA